MLRLPASTLLRAWLLTAATDGIFSSALSVFAYGSTVTRLWQGVAATLLGATALTGGLRTAGIGVLLHVGVALGWSAVFFMIATTSMQIREILATRGGVAKVAAIYGPIIWLTMSLAVIPLLTGRPPTLTVRWWVQLFGHIPFVALPIVAMTARGVRARAAAQRVPGASSMS